MCDQCVAKSMGAEVVKFLVRHEELPPFIHKADDKAEQAINRLNNRLGDMQRGLEDSFIRQLRELGVLPSDMESQMAIISQILDEPFEDMKEVIADEGVEGARIGRQMTFDDFASQGVSIDITDFSEAIEQDLRNKVYEFSEDTFSRIKGDFQSRLANGYRDGLGIDEVAEGLRDEFSNLRDHRLKTIARTEIQGAQNEGAHETMVENNVEYEQWLTAQDDRVRDEEVSHVVLHGEVVEVGEAFSNGLTYPGERVGDIADWINCRCRTRPYFPRENEVIESTPYYPNSA